MELAPGALIENAIHKLQKRRTAFHSEADFQHALAWQLHVIHGDDLDVMLEVRQPNLSPRVELDLLLRLDGARIAVELKYITKSLVVDQGRLDDQFELREHGAPDLARYGFCRDLERLERVIDAGLADAGVAVLLTNDPGLWSERPSSAADLAFRLHQRTLTGRLAWAPTATAAWRAQHPALTLRRTYSLVWRDFSTHPGGRNRVFRYLLVEVGGPSATEVQSGLKSGSDGT